MRSTLYIKGKKGRVWQKLSTGNQRETNFHLLKQRVYPPAAGGYITPAKEGGAKENTRARKGRKRKGPLQAGVVVDVVLGPYESTRGGKRVDCVPDGQRVRSLWARASGQHQGKGGMSQSGRLDRGGGQV